MHCQKSGRDIETSAKVRCQLWFGAGLFLNKLFSNFIIIFLSKSGFSWFQFLKMKIFGRAIWGFGFLLFFFGIGGWLLPMTKDMQLDRTGGLLFMSVGAAFYLGGKLAEKYLPERRRKAVKLNPNDISFIFKAMRRHRRMVLGLALGLGAFTLLIGFALVMDINDYPSVVIAVFATLFLSMFVIIVVFLLVKYYRLGNPYKTRLYAILTRSPHKVSGITVYFVYKEGAPYRVGQQIIAGLHIDGKIEELPVTEQQLSLLLQYLKLHNPQITYDEKDVELKG